jgi:hypothetical protein
MKRLLFNPATVIPTINQDMCLRAFGRFKIHNLVDRHVDFAQERNIFLLTNRLLPVHLGWKWTALP